MKWIELTSATDGGKFMLNAEAIESVSPRGEDSENNWYETIVTTIGSPADAYFCIEESYEQIKAMLTGEKPAEQPDIDEAKRIAFRTGYEAGVKEATKHSQWIVDRYGDCTCKSCGCGNICKTNYCPECGADMRKEAEKHEID